MTHLRPEKESEVELGVEAQTSVCCSSFIDSCCHMSAVTFIWRVKSVPLRSRKHCIYLSLCCTCSERFITCIYYNSIFVANGKPRWHLVRDVIVFSDYLGFFLSLMPWNSDWIYKKGHSEHIYTEIMHNVW